VVRAKIDSRLQIARGRSLYQFVDGGLIQIYSDFFREQSICYICAVSVQK